ncbi:MAG: hypothetical protein AVDCRST_MAG77-2284 [uncultured Chloroflexi bacterium]|uniref:histidine kinase n=1 Tax=uncultured Chloroflexota bacterium TaxID=166587 RepID=A0A6J4IIN7_9CHLR|nr:MAG: hypothetical protein AVDCRST_MAG77-2284 [uncultured Chloroflexota bacterium]
MTIGMAVPTASVGEAAPERRDAPEGGLHDGPRQGDPRLLASDADARLRTGAEHQLLRLTRRLRLLLEVSTTVGPAMKLGAPLDDALRTLREALPEIDTAAVFLHDPQADELVPHALVGLGDEYGRIRLRPGEGISGIAFQRSQPVRCHGREHARAMHATLRPENAAHFTAALDSGSHADHAGVYKRSVSVPLRTRGCETIGVLTLGSGRADFSDDDVSVLEGVAAQLAVALDNARLYDEVRRQADELRAALAAGLEREATIARQAEERRLINEFARVAASSLDLPPLLDRVVTEVVALTGAARCRIVRYEAAADALRVLAGRVRGGAPDPWVGHGWTLAGDPGSGVTVKAGANAGAVRTGRTVTIDDTLQSSAAPPRDFPVNGVRSVVSVPIPVGGTVWGTLNVAFAEPDRATAECVALLEGVAAHLALAVHNAQLYEDAQREIAERTAAERQVRESAARLECAYEELEAAQVQLVQQERLKALGQLAAGIAHDLNNTLAPVVGFSELLRTHAAALPRQQREWLDLLHTGALDAADVVRRLREFYRSRDGHDAFALVDLAAIVAQTVDLTRPRWKDDAQAGGRTIAVRTELAPALLPVAGSAAELREALANLVINAVDALPAGGAITVRTRIEDASVALEVHDTGGGMDEETRRRCLEPFFTTKGEKGTGLGLAMVHGTVQRHGGTIEIESAPGTGTTVRLRLPLAAPSEAAVPTAAGGVEGAGDSRPPLRLLVVDDDPAVRMVTTAMLEADGHLVVEAHDGATGLAALRTGRFDVLLTDRAMPGGMSGEQLAAEAKALHPQLPVLLLTGYGDLMAAAGESPSAVDLVLSKPVSLETLRTALAAHAGATQPAG